MLSTLSTSKEQIIQRSRAQFVQSSSFIIYNDSITFNVNGLAELQINSLSNCSILQHSSGIAEAEPNVVEMADLNETLRANDVFEENRMSLTYAFPARDMRFQIDKASAVNGPNGNGSTMTTNLAVDRKGLGILKKNIPTKDGPERYQVYLTALSDEVFVTFATLYKESFFIERLIDEARGMEIDLFLKAISGHVLKLSKDRYGYHIILKLINTGNENICDLILIEIEGHICELAVDQWGSFILLELIKELELRKYVFIVNAFLSSKETLHKIIENKYGCRVIQSTFTELETDVLKGSCVRVESIITSLADAVLEDCENFMGHRYANFVIQEILTSKALYLKRNVIIRSMLENLLSLSQEKYASHVVEKAIKVAPPRLFDAMMNEIFDGYELDSCGRGALEVLLFDQFGNYVVQAMVTVMLEIKSGKREGQIKWYPKLARCILKNYHKLKKLSSGKRIIQEMEKAGVFSQFFEVPSYNGEVLSLPRNTAMLLQSAY